MLSIYKIGNKGAFETLEGENHFPPDIGSEICSFIAETNMANVERGDDDSPENVIRHILTTSDFENNIGIRFLREDGKWRDCLWPNNDPNPKIFQDNHLIMNDNTEDYSILFYSDLGNSTEVLEKSLSSGRAPEFESRVILFDWKKMEVIVNSKTIKDIRIAKKSVFDFDGMSSDDYSGESHYEYMVYFMIFTTCNKIYKFKLDEFDGLISDDIALIESSKGISFVCNVTDDHPDLNLYHSMIPNEFVPDEEYEF